MELSKILTADILDILFEGRNKDYGAYELRKSYRRRLLLSITAMLSLILLMIGGYALANREKKEVMARLIEIPDTVLDKVTPKEEEKIELPKPKPIEKIPPVEMKKFTDFRITKDDDVKPEEKPPTMDELEDTKIGTVNQEGVKDEGITAPPVDDKGTGVVAIPKKQDEDDNAPFIKVEKESEYPGGMQAWQRYLNKTFRYPQDAADNLIQGTVVIQFIVDKEGMVSDVEAISGPEELRAEAVRVIRKSGKWIPAIQNGRQVKSYKKQPIVFRLEDQP